MSAGRKRPAAGARKNNRQVDVRMPVAVGVASAVQYHRIVQQRTSIHVLCLLELFQQFRELFHVPNVYLRDLLDLFRVVEMMGEVVMPLWNANFGKRAIASIMGEQ